MIVLAFSLIAAPTAIAKEPPSFALWSAREQNHMDAVIKPLEATCGKFSDSKGGRCLVKGLLAAYPRLYGHWSAGVTGTAKGQTPACKKAINAYRVAVNKNFAAITLFLKAHARSTYSEIEVEIAGKPYSTLSRVKEETKSHAIRVCG